MVTASGSPSGMATTRTVIPIIKYPTSCPGSSLPSQSCLSNNSSMINLRYKMTVHSIPAINPILLTSVAIFSNLHYKGVAVTSASAKSLIFPSVEFDPTQVINIFPMPFSTVVPPRHTGLDTACLKSCA